jgi:hypothetical protein
MELARHGVATMTLTGEPARTLPALRAGAVSARRWPGAGLAAWRIGWGANQFTPMLLLYRARLGLSASVVQAVFAMYAIGLVPRLLRAARCRSGAAGGAW